MAGSPGTDVAPGETTDAIMRWLLGDARRLQSEETLLSGLCPRLVAAGVPIARVTLHFRTLHPLIGGRRVLWHRDAAAVEETPYLRRNEAIQEMYLKSPMYVVYTTGEPVRRRIENGAALFDFPILADLHAEGFTDYFIAPITFGNGDRHAVSWSSRQPGGFGDRALETIEAVLPALAAVVEAIEVRRTMRTLLDTYLGHQAGIQVLNGTIARGDGQAISAALWYCDLRGFTAMADQLPGDALIALLNDYFGCMAAPVHARGGEVLKFIGDAMLAIFPMVDDLDRDRACNTALAAAEAALDDLDSLNEVRRIAGESPIEIGLALHAGAVMYGNIGAPDRLDFTVIGPAVNVVTRIEGLCPQLGRRLLASARFASPCGSRLQSLGFHRLKGIAVPQEIFGLPGAD